MNTQYLVICEGVSECNCLLHLNRLMRALPPPEGCFRSLEFVGLPKTLDALTLKRKGVGSGEFGKVVQAYKGEYKRARSAKFLIWVDDDLYVRNDKSCGVNYERRPAGIPAFSFSTHNFEDYLALHLSDELFELWKSTCSANDHFSSPLYGADYERCFRLVLPDYKKGELPDDFLSLDALQNMVRHQQKLPAMATGPINRSRTFAADLAAILATAYPDVFRDGNCGKSQ